METPRALMLGWIAVLAAVAVTLVLGAGVEEGFDLGLYSALTVILASSGVLILARHPGHGVGLLFCAQAAWLAVTELADAYGNRARTADLPAGEYGEWVISWSWIGDFTIWLLILMTFPSGRLLSRRWRFVPRVLGAGALLAAVGYAVDSSDAREIYTRGENPFAVDALPGDAMFAAGMALVMACSVAAVASLVLRFARARGVERQQLKWFAAAALLVGATMPFAVAFWTDTLLVQIALGLAFLALPTTACIAILRYRLYDIDVVINRALVYGALTASLAATYVGTVLVLQLVLPASSDLAIAGSTLAVAALIRPARARIQDVVDRRFFRSRYDATQTLAAFGSRLRDEVSLDAVASELRAATTETLQPAHISVWMRP